MIKYRHLKEVISFYLNVKFRYIPKLRDSTMNCNICIFSVSRSGSTWFSEILNTLPNSTVVTEPFYRYPVHKLQIGNPYAFPEQKNAHFLWDQYVPKEAELNDLYSYTSKLFNRGILNLRINHTKESPKIATAHNFIYKFCFANQKMEWMNENFDFHSILLNRHPCAVISSQLKYGFSREKNMKFNYLNNYFSDPFVEGNREYLNSLSTPEEVLAAKYAHSYHGLHEKVINKEINNSYSIFYENLLADPEKELLALFNFLGSKPNSTTFEAFTRKSRTSLRENSIIASKQLEQWKNELSKIQIDRIIRVTQNLGIDYYTTDAMPNLRKAASIDME